MKHEATRQHRRRTCSCSQLEALAASKRRLERKALVHEGVGTFTASVLRALKRAGL